MATAENVEIDWYDFQSELEGICQQLGVSLCYDRTIEVDLMEDEGYHWQTKMVLNCLEGAPPLREQLAAEMLRVARFYTWLAAQVQRPQTAAAP